MAKNGGGSGGSASGSSSSDESFLTKPVYGQSSVKWWMALLGSLATVGAVVAYKKYHK